MAQLLDGKATAQNLWKSLKRRCDHAKQAGFRPPGLAVVLIGDDPASHVYVGRKQAACNAIGIEAQTLQHPANTSTDELLAVVDHLNQNERVDGILVQLPLPNLAATQAVIDRIAPTKDVDGFHPLTMGKRLLRQPGFRPCTPFGIMLLLNAYGLELRGRDAVVVGASNIVGRPMACELLEAHATVTLCHSQTQHLAQHVGRAELLVVATGRRDAVDSHWIAPGAVVIDVGIHREGEGLVGDLNFDVAAERASWITPVPGGVGPMTIAALMHNTVQAWADRTGAPSAP